MGRLREAVTRAGIRLTRYDGAGSIAAALLSKYHVKVHLKPEPPELHDPVRRVYFGGRFDVAGAGYVDDVYGYDIKSAYPYIQQHLPCLACGVNWEKTRTYDPAGPWALWRVRWDIPRSNTWAPFPWRHKQSIYYLG
jgi:hypothetical protein